MIVSVEFNGLPSFSQVIFSGESPSLTTQTTCTRAPSCILTGKLNGSILGGTENYRRSRHIFISSRPTTTITSSSSVSVESRRGQWYSTSSGDRKKGNSFFSSFHFFFFFSFFNFHKANRGNRKRARTRWKRGQKAYASVVIVRCLIDA